MRGGRPAVFLDYDGTLTPIVARPDLAILDPAVRETLRRLVGVADVAIVSGRDLDDVAALVDLVGVTVAGSHGFEVLHPDGRRETFAGAESFASSLADAADDLTRRLAGIRGARVERKGFAVAVHFREAAPDTHEEIAAATSTVASAAPLLRLGYGKMVVELRPDVDWHKGRLVAALLERRSGEGRAAYLGDDVTDEDAFEVIGDFGRGAGVIVGERAHGPTAARYALADVLAVHRWLDDLARGLA
jgi:trehalose 6-phosphate phosphatase